MRRSVPISPLLSIEKDFLSLHPFDSSLPTKISTDASDIGIGVVLWQQHEENWAPVAFRSQTFNPTQRNWSTIDKEMFAIKVACEKFRNYIYNLQAVTIETDHKPIMAIFNQTDLSHKHSRWLASLIGYNFHIVYIQGATHHLPDYLSRILIAHPQKTDDVAHINNLQLQINSNPSIALGGASPLPSSLRKSIVSKTYSLSKKYHPQHNTLSRSSQNNANNGWSLTTAPRSHH